ncbi:MAG: hypothetical protein K0Q72_1291 [Armatimonadetes bacterium]|jgi:hypothetical protein|nr:hypothetical protein [Armatimonadota bacterium]
MVPALLSFMLLLGPSPDLLTWRETPLPSARMVVETPGELKALPAAPGAGGTRREQWEMKRGSLIIRVEHARHVKPPTLNARQYLKAFSGALVGKKAGSRAELKERLLLGKPGVELRVTDQAKSGINIRTCLMQDGLEEWRWEASYAPEFEKEEEIDHFFNSIRALPAAELPTLVSQSPGPVLTLSLPGKPQAEEQPLDEAQKKAVKARTLHTLSLPDRSVFYLMHAEYQDEATADPKNDFLGLLNAALARSAEKVAPKIEVARIPNAIGYQARSHTRVGENDFTYRITSFSAGRHSWGILMLAPNTVRHEKLLDTVFKSITVSR